MLSHDMPIIILADNKVGIGILVELQAKRFKLKKKHYHISV